jgi:hypothetical protein
MMIAEMINIYVFETDKKPEKRGQGRERLEPRRPTWAFSAEKLLWSCL